MKKIFGMILNNVKDIFQSFKLMEVVHLEEYKNSEKKGRVENYCEKKKSCLVEKDYKI